MRAAAFHLLSILACLFALAAVTRRNPVHAALLLALALLALAADYLVLGAVFLALAQVFVYAGAIVVLFVFVLMILGTREEDRRMRSGGTAGVALAAILFAVIAAKLSAALSIGIKARETLPEDLSAVLVGTGGFLGEHAFAFELGSVLVLTALVGAMTIARIRP